MSTTKEIIINCLKDVRNQPHSKLKNKLNKIDEKINKCNECKSLVDKFPNANTVYLGTDNDIVLIGEAPANNGWRKSGMLWKDPKGKVLPSGVVLQKLFDKINRDIFDTTFLEAVKCYPLDRKNLKQCSINCKNYMLKQLEVLSPKLIITLGEFPTRTLLPIKFKKFGEVVGRIHKVNNLYILPIYHPSPISPKSYKDNLPIFEMLQKELKEVNNMKINEDLKKYIEENIFPVYANNDSGHNQSHIDYVIKRSMKFANTVADINYDIVYTVAAYHDIARHIDDKNHEKLSAEAVYKDKELTKYFTDEEIKIISEAVEDHRASLEYEPRSIYGKIVSSADRNSSLAMPITRTYEYRIARNPEAKIEDIIEEARTFIIHKFGREGYAKEKMYFKDEEYEQFLDEIATLCDDEEAFAKKFKELNNIK